jgi:hypothetical protein
MRYNPNSNMVLLGIYTKQYIDVIQGQMELSPVLSYPWGGEPENDPDAPRLLENVKNSQGRGIHPCSLVHALESADEITMSAPFPSSLGRLSAIKSNSPESSRHGYLISAMVRPA